MQRHGGISYSLTGHANDLFRPGDPDDSPAPARCWRGLVSWRRKAGFAAARMRARHPELARFFCPVHNGLDVASFPVAEPARTPRAWWPWGG